MTPQELTWLLYNVRVISAIGVGAGKFLWVRRIFARISSNLPEKFLDHLLCEYFFLKTVFGMKKTFHVILHTLGPIFSKQSKLGAAFARIFSERRFSGFLPRFSRILSRFPRILPISLGRVSVQKWPVFIPSLWLKCFMAALKVKAAVKGMQYYKLITDANFKASKAKSKFQLLCYQYSQWMRSCILVL